VHSYRLILMNEEWLIKPRHPLSIYYYSWCHCSYPISIWDCTVCTTMYCMYYYVLYALRCTACTTMYCIHYNVIHALHCTGKYLTSLTINSTSSRVCAPLRADLMSPVRFPVFSILFIEESIFF